MVVQIAGADIQIARNVIGGDAALALLVEQLQAGFDNAVKGWTLLSLRLMAGSSRCAEPRDRLFPAPAASVIDKHRHMIPQGVPGSTAIAMGSRLAMQKGSTRLPFASDLTA
ncbi:hypothetical protein [Aquitalea pelogenes]|uniref:hypothetical protein n=1 Tax=Aquitalea pelogenes TaxID=1293573 RepID=UPI000788A933|nr:hypothetical protein [Aquitalea pelogenes]